LTMTNVKICGWSGQKLKEGPKGVGDWLDMRYKNEKIWSSNLESPGPIKITLMQN
jgi:hypothetical protein